MTHQITVTSIEPSDHPSCQLSYKLIPEVWYENITLLRLLYLAAVLILQALFLTRYGYAPPRFWSVIGVSLCVLGFLVDTVSTELCARLARHFSARNLPFPVVETNPFLNQLPSLSEQIFNFTTLFGVAAATMSWFAPGLGLALGGLKIGVGVSNLRQRQRLQVQLELFDEVEKSPGVYNAKNKEPETHLIG